MRQSLFRIRSSAYRVKVTLFTSPRTSAIPSCSLLLPMLHNMNMAVSSHIGRGGGPHFRRALQSFKRFTFPPEFLVAPALPLTVLDNKNSAILRQLSIYMLPEPRMAAAQLFCRFCECGGSLMDLDVNGISVTHSCFCILLAAYKHKLQSLASFNYRQITYHRRQMQHGAELNVAVSPCWLPASRVYTVTRQPVWLASIAALPYPIGLSRCSARAVELHRSNIGPAPMIGQILPRTRIQRSLSSWL